MKCDLHTAKWLQNKRFVLLLFYCDYLVSNNGPLAALNCDFIILFGEKKSLKRKKTEVYRF